MARPKSKVKPETPKIENKQEVTLTPQTTPTINIDEAIAKAVAVALAQKEAEFQKQLEQVKSNVETKVEIKAVETPKFGKSGRRFIPDNTRIRIEQNIDGKFLISDNRGQNFFIELNGYKDSTTMAYKDLKNFYGRSHTFFTSGKLAITDVVSDSEITLEDVIYDLNLQKTYYDEKRVSPVDVENLFYDDVTTVEFEKKLQNSLEIAETMLEVAYVLYKRGQFSDNAKMNVFRQILRNPQLFTNV
jgi:hypothetical protein